MRQQAASTYADFDDVTQDYFDHPLASVKEFDSLIMDSDNPIEMAYYFGKNPDEMDKIGGMTPAQAARYMGRLESQIEKKPQSLEPTKKMVSNAPKPVSPVGSAKPEPAVKDPNTMTQAEYIAWRQGKK
jgi:hypothetical protein